MARLLPPAPDQPDDRLAAGVQAALRATPTPPRSLAAELARDIVLAHQLQVAALTPAPSLAARLAARIAAEGAAQATQTPTPAQMPTPAQSPRPTPPKLDDATLAALLRPPLPPAPASLAPALVARIAHEARQAHPAAAGQRRPGASRPLPRPARLANPAGVALIAALVAGVLLLGVTSAWPNLAAGTAVLRALFAQVTPLFVGGVALLLLTSLVVVRWPTRAIRRGGALAFGLAAALTLPALYGAATSGTVTLGRDVVVGGIWQGDVLVVGGNVRLRPGARVQGEVVTFLGDVTQEPGAAVGGQVSALLGRVSAQDAPGGAGSVSTRPVTLAALPALSELGTANAWRPLLQWMGSAAWPRIFAALLCALMLLLLLGGLAEVLARRQRQAPVRTLARGILTLLGLLLPLCGLALSGLLAPALALAAFGVLLLACGLAVTLYDLGRLLARRLRLPVPGLIGPLMGLCTFAAATGSPGLATLLTLVGGVWGAGTLALRSSPAGQR